MKLCVKADSLNCLRDLLHYHVILDSEDSLDFLTILRLTHPEVSWIKQMQMDIAWRVGDINTLLGMLVREQKPYEALNLLKKLLLSEDGNEFLQSNQPDLSNLVKRVYNQYQAGIIEKFEYQEFIDGIESVSDRLKKFNINIQFLLED
jgi:hypothetical protein